MANVFPEIQKQKIVSFWYIIAGYLMDTPKKQKFEVKQYFDFTIGRQRKDIFVDDKLFEYEVDPDSLRKAKQMGPYYFIAAQRELQKHFLDSLSDFMGRKVTQTEVMEATKNGWI